MIIVIILIIIILTIAAAASTKPGHHVRDEPVVLIRGADGL